MGQQEEGATGILGDNPSREDLARACHDIIGAASVLVINFEFLAQTANAEHQGAVIDSRRSIERIVALARALRRAMEKERTAQQP